MRFQLYSAKKFASQLLFMIVFTLISDLCFSQESGQVSDTSKTGETVETFRSKDSLQTTTPGDTVSGNYNREERESEDSVVFREVPDSIVKQMKSEKAFAYANNPAYWKRDEQEDSWLAKFYQWLERNVWFSRLLYILFGAILVLVIYMIVVKTLYSSARHVHTKKEGPVEAEDPDFSARIDAAIAAKDFRNAIRFLYLKALKIAGERNLIQLTSQFTNQDYLLQLRQHPVKESFGLLTHVHEKACYGGFDTTEDQFLVIRNQFDQLFKTMAA
jgi:hypothetical protein